MKRCGILALAALATILNGRLNAAVESDVVGYTTITLESGKWYQIGSPFVNLDENVTEVSIQTLFTDFADGDVILIYNGIAYDYAFWRSDKASEGNGGWCTTSGGPKILSSLKLSKGGAVFINKGSSVDTEISFTGKVSYEEIPFGTEGGKAWTMITPVWPEEIKLSDLQFTNVGDQDKVLIYIPTSGEYQTGYWRSAVSEWCTTSGGPTITFNPTLTVGQALFINKVTPEVGTVSLK